MMQNLLVGLIILSALGFLVKKYFFTSKKCSSCSINSKPIPADD